MAWMLAAHDSDPPCITRPSPEMLAYQPLNSWTQPQHEVENGTCEDCEDSLLVKLRVIVRAYSDLTFWLARSLDLQTPQN